MQEQQMPHNTILEVQDGIIDINEIFNRMDPIIPPIKITEENEHGKDGK